MFPACAGMNRPIPPVKGFAIYVPRVRGDEPGISRMDRSGDAMFPACAGMNRPKAPSPILRAYVPRVRGDEPIGHVGRGRWWICSPRARG